MAPKVSKLEAKARRHVYNSGLQGCGGGSAEPIDKRGKEDFPCPYCEPPRVFKQKDRLKQHVQNHHGDEEEVRKAEEAAAAAAAAPPPPRAAIGGPQPVKGPDGKAPAITYKSPKVILSEYLQKHNRPKARFVEREAPDGGWICKVVLPDPRKPDSDVVMWMEDAQNSKDDAVQHAAVNALARVAFNLPLQRLLPPEFKQRFVDEEQRERDRQERERIRAEEAARRRAYENRPKEKLQTVYMSEDKRRIVEQAIAELQLDSSSGPGAAADDGLGGEGAEGVPAAVLEKVEGMGFSVVDVAALAARPGIRKVSQALDWLVLNVPEERLPTRFTGKKGEPISIVRLVSSSNVAGGASSSALSASQSMGADLDEEDGGDEDWETLAEGDGDGDGTEGVLSEALPDVGPELEGPLRALVQRGYAGGEAAEALTEASASASASAAGEGEPPADADTPAFRGALEALFGRVLQSAAPGIWELWPRSSSSEGDRGAWEEERMAIEAIFGEDARLPSAEGAEIDVRVSHPSCTPPEDLLTLEVRLPEGSAYPSAPPLLSVRSASGAMPQRALRRLTEKLAAVASEAAGNDAPCVHELAAGLAEAVAELPASLFVAARPVQVPRQPAAAAAAPQGQQRTPQPVPRSQDQRQQPQQQQQQRQQQPQQRHRQQGRGGGRGGKGAEGEDWLPQRRRGPEDVARENSRLLEHSAEYFRAQTGPFAAMRAARARLPAAEARGEVVTCVANNRVVVLSGETGCGKSTQVPQFILEAMIRDGKGAECTIICTQPRRISAIGLADRVSAERGERVGDVVGYSVRLESRRSERTRLLFCTTGVLLRRLLGDPRLEDVSHVVLDEVHERSVESDLLLLLLRQLLARRPTLRIILMSATADSALFADYFAYPPPGGPHPGSVGRIEIPGFTHPVMEYHLEDIFERTGFLVGKNSKYARRRKPASGIVDDETGEEVPTWQETAPDADPDEDDDGPGKKGGALRGAGGSSGAGLSGLDGGAAAQEEAVPDSWEEAAESGAEPAANVAPAPAATTAGPSGKGSSGQLARPPSGQALALSKGPPQGQPPPLTYEQLRAMKMAEVEAERLLQDYDPATKRSLSNVDESIINYELIEALLQYILLTEERLGPSALVAQARAGGAPSDDDKAPGAILVFLPGMPEISKLQRKIERSDRLQSGDVGQLWVLPLHGSLSSEDQKRVFERPPKGFRKVVLATNVAETSVTIDDVRYVVDTGRAKEMRYEASRGLSTLEEDWISAAAAKQRRGRAGRTAPGACFKLYSRKLAAQRPLQQAPEMLRVPLEALCLRVKALCDGPVAGTLAQALTPPAAEAVESAVATLRGLRALDDAEALTPLGECLVRMPMDARLGKMIIYGAMLRCLGPILTVCGALSGRSLFFMPRDQEGRAAADRARAALAAGAAKSDHLTLVKAWLAARDRGHTAERAFIDANFLSWQALDGVRASREDYASILVDLGFVPRAYLDHLRGSRGDSAAAAAAAADVNAGNSRVVKAALCAGLYPNVLRVRHPEQTFVQTTGGSVAKEAEARTVKFFSRETGRVFLHPSSVNFGVGKFESGWMVYSEAVKTAKVYIRESTMVPAYALLLFGGEIEVKHEKGILTVDKWAEFEASPRIAVLVRELRAGVDRLLLSKVADPSLDVWQNPAVAALLQLIATDGF